MDKMRASMVGSMKNGRLFVINMSRAQANWSDFDMGENDFPVNSIFDINDWKDESKHMKIVRESENVDLNGNEGQYVMDNNFRICFLLNSSSDEKYNETISNIPHAD